MLKREAKLKRFKKLKTETQLVFSIDGDIDIDIMQAQGHSGYLAFNHDPFKTEVEDIMKNKKIGIREDGLSCSESYRGYLFQIWAKSTKTSDFETYYRRVYDELEKKAKAKL